MAEEESAPHARPPYRPRRPAHAFRGGDLVISEDDRREAWWTVIDQIDTVLDGEPLPATDRGALLAMRRQANERIAPGAMDVPDFVPADWDVAQAGEEIEGDRRREGGRRHDDVPTRDDVLTIPEPAVAQAQLDRFYAAIAEAASDAITDVALLHPDRAGLCRVVGLARRAAGLPSAVSSSKRPGRRSSMPAIDGIGMLGLALTMTGWVLHHSLCKAGLLTIADVELAISDGRLESLVGCRAVEVMNAVDWYRTRQRLVRNAYAAAGLTPREIADGPDGISRLDLPCSVWTKLFQKGILLADDLVRLDEAGKLEQLHGIGARTLGQIRVALERRGERAEEAR